MSTKNTILLVKDDHWYHEGLTGEFILEFSFEHGFNINSSGVTVMIRESSSLGKELRLLQYSNTE